MTSTRTALITGASAGIGTAFAYEFAKHGYSLVLVARREPRLKELASQIQSKYDVDVSILPVDLAESDAGQHIEAFLNEETIGIDCLVNNAGYGLDGGFLDNSWHEHLAMHQVMLTGYTELCYRLLPGMVERGFGRIINVSSVAALVPAVPSSMYSGIKRYVTDLSLSLDFEFRDQGIHCCSVCPGFTYTEFHDVMGVRKQATNNYPKFMWQSAEVVAAEGYAAVMKGQLVLVNGIFNRLYTGILNLLPRSLQYRIGRHGALFED